MRATTPKAWLMGSLSLVAVLALFGSARTSSADDLGDAIRLRKIAADKFESDLREGWAEAEKLSKKDPKKAIEVLENLSSILSVNRLLSEERRQQWADAIKSRIVSYRQMAVSTVGVGGGTFEERMRRLQDRNRQTEEKNAELKQLHAQMADLYKRGKYDEVGKLGRQMEDKYGRSPSSMAAMRAGQAAGALAELQSLKDERSARYMRSMNEVIKASMPIIGEVEFPADWKERTKRRTKTNLTPKEEELLRALNKPVTLKVEGQPIQAVLEEFEKRFGITINLDKLGLDQAQLTSESPVSVNAKGQTLRSVLKKMLGDVGLTYTIRAEGLRVTTPTLAANDMVIRAYYIGDLLGVAGMQPGGFGGTQLAMVQNVASLINMIQGIDPGSWQSGGGLGQVHFEPNSMTLIVKQSAEAQFMLQGWLK